MKKKRFTLFILMIIFVSFFLFYKEGSLPVNKNSTESKIFVVKKGENMNDIIKNLAKEELIRNRVVFYLIVKQLGIERKIQAGSFRLSPAMDAYTIASNLTHGTLDVWLTIIEGLRKEEIAQIVSQNLGIPETEFLKNAPQEGYLFPDTYLIPEEATAGGIIEILVTNYYRRFDENLKAQAKKNGLTEKEVLILASLVEKEGRNDADRQKIASIILKRYRKDWPLQLDASVQYALGYQTNEKTWWKKSLTEDDLKIDSLYNTYKYTGLPPTPIANPGLSSIKAVVNANINTPYWYYLSDTNGKMHYAVTLEEHNANIKKYLQ